MSVQLVKEYLKQWDFDKKVKEFDESSATVELAAHAVGVGSCWIHRAREEFSSQKGKELLKEWGIPESYEGIGHVALGYPDMEAPEPLPRKKDYIHYVD